MKSVRFALLLVFALFTGSVAMAAADRGTPDEAKAMALKAAQYLKEVGPAKAFAAFDAKDGPWHDRDLYVFVQDENFTVKAHGAMPTLIGRSFPDLKDVDGKPFPRLQQAIKTEGWVEYKWKDPVTNLVRPKKTYVVRVGDLTVAVGAYAD